MSINYALTVTRWLMFVLSLVAIAQFATCGFYIVSLAIAVFSMCISLLAAGILEERKYNKFTCKYCGEKYGKTTLKNATGMCPDCAFKLRIEMEAKAERQQARCK